MASSWTWSVLAFVVICHLAAAAPESSSRKERFLLSVLKFHNSRCSGGNTGGLDRIEGVCQHRAHCRHHRGKNLGTCAVFGTCCAVERSCSSHSALQVAYFVNPVNYEASCSYRVDLEHRDVCQIRLDFEQFKIAPPTKPDDVLPDSIVNNLAYRCQNDSFFVTSALGHNLPILCGENTGQHMYVAVNRSQGINSIMLSFSLADRAVVKGLSAATWRIKVSQIECSGMTNDYSSISSAIHTYNHQHWNLHLPVNDHLRMAPPGCLQYYIERDGTYESFNYNNGDGPYMGDLNYAICFRKYPDVCGIRHTPNTFWLSYNNFLEGYTSSDCDSTSGVELPNQDYLYVPEGFTNNNVIASKYCGLAINSTNFVTSVAPGPLEVFFRSDNIARPLMKEKGFQIKYQMISSGCHSYN